MIVSAPSDYREAARRRLPRFLFDYIDGGAVAENTMNANAAGACLGSSSPARTVRGRRTDAGDHDP
ncbi:hypothetical protein LNP74_29285 [Klebsiella pneumoniae subsp. pneumoniae]|nr:hypothetical protein [Klebsiella pneumoniae subsp. pneumoniae]